jgi:hypothetical protein
MDQISAKAGVVADKVKDWGSEMQQAIAYSDSIEGNLKALLGYQVKMGYC